MSSKKTQQKLKDYLGRVINGNCIEIMKKMPDESVDTVVTDPP